MEWTKDAVSHLLSALNNLRKIPHSKVHKAKPNNDKQIKSTLQKENKYKI